MKAIKTQATNIEYMAPKNWNAEDHGPCSSLWVYHDDAGMKMSYWQPTFFERVKILFGRNIRLTLVCDKHPPISVEVDPNALKETK